MDYSDTGLFGLYGSCAAGGEAALVESMVASIKGVAGGVSAGDFAAAHAKAALSANTDGSSAAIAENLASSALFGTASAGLSFDGITADSCASAAAAALKTNPSVASLGALSSMPGIETVKGMF